jgi:hypothetical protein
MAIARISTIHTNSTFGTSVLSGSGDPAHTAEQLVGSAATTAAAVIEKNASIMVGRLPKEQNTNKSPDLLVGENHLHASAVGAIPRIARFACLGSTQKNGSDQPERPAQESPHIV